jgi:hypothetical protein
MILLFISTIIPSIRRKRRESITSEDTT